MAKQSLSCFALNPWGTACIEADLLHSCQCRSRPFPWRNKQRPLSWGGGRRQGVGVRSPRIPSSSLGLRILGTGVQLPGAPGASPAWLLPGLRSSRPCQARRRPALRRWLRAHPRGSCCCRPSRPPPPFPPCPTWTAARPLAERSHARQGLHAGHHLGQLRR